MKTVGEILASQRIKKKLALEEVSRKTKIKISYLQAIETNQFESLPPAAFVKGFIQNYAKAVGANPDTALAIFRRDYIEDKQGKIIPRSFTKPVSSPPIITPKTTLLVGIVATILIIGGVFARQIYIFYTAPPLDVTTPKEAAQVASPVKIEGKTAADATVSVNNTSITVKPDGTFNSQLQLSPGDHNLVITATSRSNKKRTVYRLITVKEQ